MSHGKKANHISDGDAIRFTSKLVNGKPNYRVVTISKRYWEECGSPDLASDLFKRCVYIGYGASATRCLLLGIAGSIEDVSYTAEFMGYSEGGFTVELARD